MKITASLFLVLMIALVLSGCGLIYGEKILEKDETFSKSAVFEFDLTEDTAEHKINLQISYQKTRDKTQGEFTAELIDPSGTTQTKSFNIRNSDRKTALSASYETTLFKIMPQTGKYTLKINEDQFSHIKGKKFKIKSL